MAIVLDRNRIPLELPSSPVEGEGRSSPLGATILAGGVNFCIYSCDASVAALLFFDSEDGARPACVISFSAVSNRTYHYWHVFVSGVQPGQLYAYRVQGPFEPASGLR